MSKKKIEHILFDRDRKPKRSIPFSKVNKTSKNKAADTSRVDRKKIPNVF